MTTTTTTTIDLSNCTAYATLDGCLDAATRCAWATPGAARAALGPMGLAWLATRPRALRWLRWTAAVPAALVAAAAGLATSDDAGMCPWAPVRAYVTLTDAGTRPYAPEVGREIDEIVGALEAVRDHLWRALLAAAALSAALTLASAAMGRLLFRSAAESPSRVPAFEHTQAPPPSASASGVLDGGGAGGRVAVDRVESNYGIGIVGNVLGSVKLTHHHHHHHRDEEEDEEGDADCDDLRASRPRV